MTGFEAHGTTESTLVVRASIFGQNKWLELQGPLSCPYLPLRPLQSNCARRSQYQR